ncbi:hypothetical protein OVN20_04325 [Microcella daejeonensis]|uniref:hypothetical protein n=1 Tax=Microcella daejeonensis TaxID=2994971 RepID=UPI002270DE71|nr:hypothetical protein [Microcella daejeonensis]WAB84798.1 hypothetical protein OVN20_04325 [Microcella daejeonensis]
MTDGTASAPREESLAAQGETGASSVVRWAEGVAPRHLQDQLIEFDRTSLAPLVEYCAQVDALGEQVAGEITSMDESHRRAAIERTPGLTGLLAPPPFAGVHLILLALCAGGTAAFFLTRRAIPLEIAAPGSALMHIPAVVMLAVMVAQGRARGPLRPRTLTEAVIVVAVAVPGLVVTGIVLTRYPDPTIALWWWMLAASTLVSSLLLGIVLRDRASTGAAGRAAIARGIEDWAREGRELRDAIIRDARTRLDVLWHDVDASDRRRVEAERAEALAVMDSRGMGAYAAVLRDAVPGALGLDARLAHVGRGRRPHEDGDADGRIVPMPGALPRSGIGASAPRYDRPSPSMSDDQ